MYACLYVVVNYSDRSVVTRALVVTGESSSQGGPSSYLYLDTVGDRSRRTARLRVEWTMHVAHKLNES